MLNVKSANQAATASPHDFQFPVDTKVAWIRMLTNDGRFVGFMFAAIDGISGTIGTGSNAFTFDAGAEGQEYWFTPSQPVDLNGVTHLRWEVELSDWEHDGGESFNVDFVIPDIANVNLSRAALVAPVGGVEWDAESGLAPAGAGMHAFGYRDKDGEHWCLSLGYQRGTLTQLVWSTSATSASGELPLDFLNPLMMDRSIAATAQMAYAYNGTSAP